MRSLLMIHDRMVVKNWQIEIDIVCAKGNIELFIQFKMMNSLSG